MFFEERKKHRISIDYAIERVTSDLITRRLIIDFLMIDTHTYIETLEFI